MTGKALMTLRVSRDGGRTWSETVEITERKAGPPPLSSQWPPCRCRRCTAENGPEHRTAAPLTAEPHRTARVRG